MNAPHVGGLGGTGIGTFGDKLRDAVRGGGCCDSGNALVANQGYINGLYYDPNPAGTGRAAGFQRAGYIGASAG